MDGEGGDGCTEGNDLGTCCTAKAGYVITGESGTFKIEKASAESCGKAKVTKKFCPSGATAQASTCQADCTGCAGFTTPGATCAIDCVDIGPYDGTPCKDWINEFACTAEALKKHDFSVSGYTDYKYKLAAMMQLREACPKTCDNCNGCTAGKPNCGTGGTCVSGWKVTPPVVIPALTVKYMCVQKVGYTGA